MHAYHPTTIKMHSNHCPWAVQLWKNRIPYDRSIFHTGVVAHRVLEDIGNNPNKEPKIIADNVVEKYCSEGRAYDNVPEPPAPFTDALEGAKLALEWHRIHPVPHGDGVTHEHPFAYTQNWTEVPYYSKQAKFRTLIDVVEIIEEYDETSDSAYTVAVVRDYKTSWVATHDELDSFQRRCQAVVVWLKYKPDVLVLEICNLRIKANYRREIIVAHEEDMLREWKHDISLAIRTLDGDLNPNPGVGCIRCPYTERCQHFHVMYDSKDIVKRYIAAKEVIAKLEPQIKKAMKEQPPQSMHGGKVGYATKERRKILPSAKQTLLQAWKDQDGTIEQLFQNMELGVRAIDKICKILKPNKAERQELADKLTTSEQYSAFGIHKDKKL